MKKAAMILLSVLAVLITVFTLAEKKAPVSAQTAQTDEIVLAELNMDAQADTLGGSTGGAPVLTADELAAFVLDFEDGAQ